MVESDIIYEGILNEKRIGDNLIRNRKVILYKNELVVSILEKDIKEKDNDNKSYKINLLNCIVAPINKDKFKTPNCFEIYCITNQV